MKENADELQYIDAAGDFFHPDEAMTRYEILSALSNLFEIEDLGMKADFTRCCRGILRSGRSLCRRRNH